MAVAFVEANLRHVVSGEVEPSLRFAGGQSSADERLEAFDVSGYAASHNEVYPQPARGSSGISPYIRHGMLSLRQVWDHVADGPPRDVAKFRTELLWQEYARHWYARLGHRSRDGVMHRLDGEAKNGWNRAMACMELPLDELEEDGWLVNQTRLWLASQWAVRQGARWQDGEDAFFRHLLDGSRAANRLGWQIAVGVGASKHYGFSRWQVEQRARNLCASCDLALDCPVEDWPEEPPLIRIRRSSELTATADPAVATGPSKPAATGVPTAVWLTAESLGMADPALAAHPDLPAVFVFDEPLLGKLQLAAKRLIFMTETLAEIGAARPLEIHLGKPSEILSGVNVATTFAPVPGFAVRAAKIRPVVVHPYRWLTEPTNGTVASFTEWRNSVVLPA